MSEGASEGKVDRDANEASGGTFRSQPSRFGIPEVWLVDLAGEGIEVYRQLTPQGYQEVRTFRRGEAFAPLLLVIHGGVVYS